MTLEQKVDQLRARGLRGVLFSDNGVALRMLVVDSRPDWLGNVVLRPFKPTLGEAVDAELELLDGEGS